MFNLVEDDIYTEQEVLDLIMEGTFDDPAKIEMREKLLDPVIKVLQTRNGFLNYINLGNQYIDANAEMLAKQYPTTKVVFPRKYVDEVLNLFGFDKSELQQLLRDMLKRYVNNAADFNSIISYPTNAIHAMALIFSDMVTDVSFMKDGRNRLRDSARQQLGITVYQTAFLKFFKPSPPHPIPTTMEYTYMHLDRSWNLVKDGDVITWIGDAVETSFAKHRTKLSLDLTPKVFCDFMNRVWNTFRQNIATLANRYYKDIDAKNSVAEDTNEGERIETNEFTKIRNNLVRRISGGDELYCKMNDTYRAIADMKAVKPPELLFDFAQKVDKKDIGNIVDLILYVFITKEGNTLEDINSVKYIKRITKFPTAIDRAVGGKPVILPMCEKYEATDKIVKAYICFVATYIMQRINGARNK